MESGKMGHLLKFLEKYFLFGTEIRVLEDRQELALIHKAQHHTTLQWAMGLIQC